MKSPLHRLLGIAALALPLACLADPDPLPPARKVPFLGVETAQASADLTDQLGLPEGTGLLVVHVLPDSAAAPSLKRHDLLLKFDDQLLVDPRQLAVLVRTHKPGDNVTLTYLRAGKQETATLRLGERSLPSIDDEERMHADRNMPFGMGPDGMDEGDLNQMLQEHALSRQDMDRILGLVNGTFGPQWVPNPAMGGPPPVVIARGGQPPMVLMRSSLDAKNSRMEYADERGTLVVTTKAGKRHLVASDPSGKKIFDGPIDTPEERQSLPADVQERLGRLEGMRAFGFQTGPDFRGVSGAASPQQQALPAPPPPPADSDRAPPGQSF